MTLETALFEHLRDFACRGTFEVHITTDIESADQQERFCELCQTLGVKCVMIELSHGQTRRQPMTASFHRGALAEVLPQIDELSQRVREAGFPVVRVKVEAMATNDGLPDDDVAARAAPATNYFEFHAKLRLPETADLDRLQAVCTRHEARLSRNALKKDREGCSERFVTQRVYRRGRSMAFAMFDDLIAELTASGYEVIHRTREYTIFDSAETLDAGWIDTPEDDE